MGSLSQARKSLETEYPKIKFLVCTADITTIETVDKAFQEIKDKITTPIHILVSNASTLLALMTSSA
jgi:short-subunit dehydrogenase